MRKNLISSLLLLIFCVNKSSFSQSIALDSTQIDTTHIATNLRTVWEMIYGFDGDIWFTERIGKVSKVNPITKQKVTLLELSNVYHDAGAGSEAGLLGMALHPNMIDTPHVYIVYTYLSSGNVRVRLTRYTYATNSLNNPLTILDNISGADYHNGSRIVITPDRKIIMTTGDAGNTSLPQNNSSLCGKFLRMNLDGSVPSDNPITNSLVWVKGSRNAQGLVLGQNGILYSSEHGPNNDDEINIINTNNNLGWPNVTGMCNSPSELQFCTDSSVTEPIKTWTPSIAPAGLDFYNHTAIPEFHNSLLLVTLKEKDLRALKLNANGTAITSEKIYFDNTFHRIRDLCVAPNGDIFIGTSNHDGRAQSPFPSANDDRIIKISTQNLTRLITKNSSNGIKIFPNPASSHLNLDFSNYINLKGYSVKIVNTLFQVIYNQPITKQTETIDLTTFDLNGIYLLFLTDAQNKTIETRKIVIQ